MNQPTNTASSRLEGTRIRTAVFTNFTQDHLDYHGSMQAYWQVSYAFKDVFTFLIMIAVLLFRPAGLFGGLLPPS